jgi:hypothetical protein
VDRPAPTDDGVSCIRSRAASRCPLLREPNIAAPMTPSPRMPLQGHKPGLRRGSLPVCGGSLFGSPRRAIMIFDPLTGRFQQRLSPAKCPG